TETKPLMCCERKLPSALLEAFDPVEGRVVAGFVGSGPSISAGLRTWPELLRACSQRLGVEKDTELALEGGSYLEVAQYLANLNGERALQECVADLIRMEATSPSELHRLIVKVPFAGIVTTDYDLLLSDADTSRLFEPPVTYQTSGFSSLPRRRFMFHLHGHINEPSSIILAKSGYDRFALGLSSRAIQFLRTIFHSHTVLFLGFGFRDENIDSILRDLKELEVSVGWSVYALVPATDPGRPEKVLDTALRHRGVFPIYLEARADHGALAMTCWLSELRRVVERIGDARLSPVSRAPQAALLAKLSLVLEAAGYGKILSPVLRHLTDRPDLAQLSEVQKE